MSKSKSKNAAPALSVDSLRDIATRAIAGHIAHFETVAQSDASAGKTALQWAQSARCDFTGDFFDACVDIAQRGIIAPETIERALSLRDTDGERAPVYGMPKLTATILSLSRGSAHPTLSKLHRACILSLSRDFRDNGEVCKGIAEYAICSVTGTAPTQRSSSAYALRVLGLIEEKREGRRGAMRWADCEGAQTLAKICG